MSFRLITLSAFLLAITSIPAHAQELKPFEATYEASYSGIGVTAVRKLSGEADNWRLQFNADSFFADIREFSRFDKRGGQLTPQHYEYHKTGLGSDRHKVLRFEPEEHRVINVRKEDRTLENVPARIQDKLSYQLQLALDIAAGKEELQYTVADGKKIRHYKFAVIGSETVKTSLGPVKATKVERVREEDADRETTIWFAPQWEYALVKLEQQEEDGKNYQISLTKLLIDGKTINARK
ncbi:DUF3108 domain-containing protein [Microbulbifer halophilus]|uniref:DUF3108 domain-containing protein n=1 Tax=Microbulbifer halophilus TaxID=453963 RepID=A0ABW5E8I5_9GAMM|nr:DUF3108 domain-containing protein [Microbulbifer halophilus]MCW8125210.1 DUF3108 domain-containing protein [Microbulbifer halophilus]